MEKVFEEMMRVNDPVLTKVAIGRMPVPKPGLKADLIGICGSPGVDERPAKVLYSAEQIGELQAGDILVAPLTYTSWTPAFALIKGAVVDQGGTLGHAAIVGREYTVSL